MTKNQYDLILKMINRIKNEFPPLTKMNLLSFIDENSYSKSHLTFDEADFLIHQLSKLIDSRIQKHS